MKNEPEVKRIEPTAEEYLRFPIGDAIIVIGEAFIRAAKAGMATGKSLPELVASIDEVSKFTKETVELPVPLSDEILGVINKLEDEILADSNTMPNFPCNQCREESSAAGRCHGVLKKGDLLKCVLSGALAQGMRVVVEEVLHGVMEMQGLMAGRGMSVKPTTAPETFNPLLNEVLGK